MFAFALALSVSGLNHAPTTVVGIVILILDVAVIVSVLAGNGTIAHKVGWTAIVLLLPLVGLVLYFLLGRRRADRPLMK